MTDYGYGRTSTKRTKSRKEQHISNQVERLVSVGIDRHHIYADDGVSGTKASRPEWDKLLSVLQPGDTVTAVSMTRIGRSLKNLMEIMAEFDKRGVNVKFLDQEIDTSTPNGRLVFHIMAALSQYEAELAQMRVTEGLEAARERHGGKLPPRGKSFTDKQREQATELLKTTTWSSGEIAKAVGVSRASLYRNMKDEFAEIRGASA